MCTWDEPEDRDTAGERGKDTEEQTGIFTNRWHASLERQQFVFRARYRYKWVMQSAQFLKITAFNCSVINHCTYIHSRFPACTKEVDHEAVVVAVYVGGRVWLKLNGDVGHGRVELEVWPRAAVLTQDVGCEVVAVVEGQQVVLTQVEAAAHTQQSGFSTSPF